MHHDAQDEYIKGAVHLQGLLPVQFNLVKQFHLFLTEVLSLRTIILIGRILPLILLLTLLQLIDPHLLLAHSQNPIRVIILMNNWPRYLADLLTLLTLIRLLDLILIQGELKSISLTLSAALSLTSSTISCSNAAYTSVLTWRNSTQTL